MTPSLAQVSTSEIAVTRAVVQQELDRFIGIAQCRCESDGKKYRRTERRHHRSWPLLISSEPRGGSQICVALHNVSRHGIAFLSNESMPPGTTLYVQLFWDADAAVSIPAVVRHTTPGRHGVLIGCEFLLDDQWEPDHTLRTCRGWYD